MSCLPQTLPRYQWKRSYDWNYRHAPSPVELPVPEMAGGPWTFCGLPVGSPLGIPAGPLLNGRWCLYYASLGFDVLTYKTVRSRARRSYRLPNLQPVRTPPLRGGEPSVAASESLEPSWAVSFGMPSQGPDTWRADAEWTRQRLKRGQLLVVSVVGTVQPQWTIEDLADDYARCARWAVDSGADAIEANFSCPNVATCDGQLYQQPADAVVVAQRLRSAVGRVPLIVKIGHFPHPERAEELIRQLAPLVDALSMTNSVAAQVTAEPGRLLFDGQPRGICGQAILPASLAQVRRSASQIRREQLPLQLIGVGGVRTAGDVRAYLDAGAHAVQIATAAMLDPLVAIRIRREAGGGRPEPRTGGRREAGG